MLGGTSVDVIRDALVLCQHKAVVISGFPRDRADFECWEVLSQQNSAFCHSITVLLGGCRYFQN